MLSAVSTSRFHLSMLRRFNVWYSVKDGNWNDPNVWRSNGAKRHTLPQPGDDVHIEHVVAWDYMTFGAPNQNYNNSIKDLYISGKLICNPGLNQTRLFANNVFCSGTLDLSGSNGGGGFLLNISGDKSFFAHFVQGNLASNITIEYSGSNDFALPDIPYYNLTLSGVKKVWLTEHLNIPGTLNLTTTGSVFELSNHDLTVFAYLTNGVSNHTLSKNGPGTVNFTGPNHILSGNVSFTGNPTINLYGSFGTLSRATGIFNLGTGILNVINTSSWNFTSGGNLPFSFGSGLNVLIAAGRTLTYVGIAPWQNDGTINGANSSSTFNISGGYCYTNSNTVMATGVFNYNSSATSTIWYKTGDILPHASYYGLVVDSGVVNLSANTNINNLTINLFGTLILGNYDLSVSAVTSLTGGITKTGGGKVSFGAITLGNSTAVINFTGGNPVVNLSGNLTGQVHSGINFGSNVINILQTLNFVLNGPGFAPWGCSTNILIAVDTTLTNIGAGVTSGGVALAGIINGAGDTSTFDNRSVFKYSNAQQPMQTGILECNATNNTFEYSFAGAQNVTTGTYRNLTLSGSGAKKLLGNVSVINTYAPISPATLDSNGFILSNP
jgi:hypothetical protein